ncbi:H-NS family nucleoid-associated regulatory protein [Paraburkholderia sp.]|uniref:H-NS family nucleoid-associated regulatory protein n=1 Tax=Paraburkholderia sp. TaxID=1926495 RepID=UPI002390D743|nr:H-NS family nucleoid-associated regulatory protein [Paraburkholderia sp.]MDE1180745.1 H-NS family nucleoid-associated regulatory protein [Paraburkholderia sp.]
MATLEQIQARVKKLQAQADAMIAKKAQAAVDQIRTLMIKHGLTTEDIEAKAKARRDAKAAGELGASTNGASKGKLVAKYRDPKTGATWSGHARPPKWIANVKDRTRFLIDGSAAATSASAAKAGPKASVAKTQLKGQKKGPQPAKYKDPVSGATWSGRGPAPAWLVAAKDRTRFLIDGAAAAVASAKPVAKAVKAKVAGKTGSVGRKAAAKKVVTAKKAIAKKAPVKKAAVSAKAAVKAVKSAVKPAAKKVAAKKPVVKKAAPRKVAAKKVSAAPVAAPVSAAPEAATAQAV